MDSRFLDPLKPPSDLTAMDRVQWEIMRATIPFFGVQNDDFKLNGSGVLLRVGDKFFVLTCSHHLEGPLHHKIPYYIAPPGASGRPIPIGGSVATYTESDALDLAVVELFPEVVDRLMPLRRFINVTEVDVNPTPRRAIYLIAGYPEGQSIPKGSEHVRETTSLRYVTGIHEHGLHPHTKYNPDAHIVLGYSRECVGAQGEASRSPHPKGMSGCGIWRLTKDDETNEWQPSDTKLVAIQHRYDGERAYVMGTWAVLAFRIIWKQYEEVKPAMRLVYPGA